MIKQKQLFLHDPENGVWGDCFRTSIACLLDLPAAEVPQFNEDTGAMNMAEQTRLMNDWLSIRGLIQIDVAFSAESSSLDDVLKTMNGLNPGLPFILTGTSKTGCNHCVVCVHGEIYCDPSLTNAGIIGPSDNGLYWVTYLGVNLR